MKLVIDRNTLLAAVRQCHLRGGPIGNPALACVALTAEKILKEGSPDQLGLRASIGLVAIDINVLASVEEEGEVAVDCKALRDTLATMPEGTLTLELKKNRLAVSHGRRKWTGNARPAADVPLLPDPPPGTRSLVLPAAELLTMLDRVKYAVPNVPGDRYGRQGIYLDVLDGKPSTIVWGSHMNVMYTPLPVPALTVSDPRWELLLRPLVIDRLRDIALEKDNSRLDLSYQLTDTGPGFAWIVSAASRICFAPPREPYPDWREMLGRVMTTPLCRLPRLAMLQSLGALTTSADADAQTRVTVDVKTAEIAFVYEGRAEKGAEPSTASFEDRVVVTDVTTKDNATFRINAHYLRDAIDAAGEDSVLSWESSGNAVFLTTERGYQACVSLVHRA